MSIYIRWYERYWKRSKVIKKYYKNTIINSNKITPDQSSLYMLKIRNDELYQVYKYLIEINCKLHSHLNQINDEQEYILAKTQSKILNFENEIKYRTRKYYNLYYKTKIYKQNIMNRVQKIQTLAPNFKKYVTDIVNDTRIIKNELDVQLQWRVIMKNY